MRPSLGSPMHVLLSPVPPKVTTPAPPLDPRFWRFAATADGALGRIGDTLRIDVRPLQQVHAPRSSAPSQPLPALRDTVASLIAGVSAAPGLADVDYPADALLRDLRALRGHLDALSEGGVLEIVLIRAA